MSLAILLEQTYLSPVLRCRMGAYAARKLPNVCHKDPSGGKTFGCHYFWSLSIAPCNAILTLRLSFAVKASRIREDERSNVSTANAFPMLTCHCEGGPKSVRLRPHRALVDRRRRSSSVGSCHARSLVGHETPSRKKRTRKRETMRNPFTSSA